MSCLVLAVSLLFFKAAYPQPIFLSLCSSSFMRPLTFIFCSAPLFRLPSWTLLRSPVPVVQSQTNGAHYSCAKNSPAAKSVQIFFLFCLPSFSHQNFSPCLPGSPRREISNGEEACQLIYQLAAHVQPSVVSRLKDWGCGTARQRQLSWLARWLAHWLASCEGSGPRAHGTRWKWVCGKCFWLQGL